MIIKKIKLKHWIIFGIGIAILASILFICSFDPFPDTDLEVLAKDISQQEKTEWISKLGKMLELKLPEDTEFVGVYYCNWLDWYLYAKVQFDKEQIDQFLNQEKLNKYSKISDIDSKFNKAELGWFDYSPDQEYLYKATWDNTDDSEIIGFVLHTENNNAELFIFGASK